MDKKIQVRRLGFSSAKDNNGFNFNHGVAVCVIRFSGMQSSRSDVCNQSENTPSVMPYAYGNYIHADA